MKYKKQRWIEFARFEGGTYEPIAGAVNPTDMRMKEDTIIDKYKYDTHYYFPNGATDCRFLYGDTLLNITYTTVWYNLV